MLICQVVSGLMVGGGQRVALDLASAFQRRAGMQTFLVLMGDKLAAGLSQPESPWLQLSSYDGRYNRPTSLARAAIALRRVLLERQVDIVHSHGWDADVIVGLAVRGTGLRHIVHQHILADWAASARAVHRARRLVTMGALRTKQTSWVAVSKAVRESLRPLRWLSPDSVRVIWNGVDLERFRPPEVRVADGPPVIGVVARLAPMKGLKFLVEAVAALVERRVECRLEIAGDGPLRSDLEALVMTRGLAGRVAFLGQCDDLSDFYRSVDVFALPSVALEGLPLSILEAMASGLPVVSTFVSGIPEVVLPGATGTLVDSEDASALANALESLLRSPALRAQMGAAGRRRAETAFSLGRMVEDVADVYESCA